MEIVTINVPDCVGVPSIVKTPPEKIPITPDGNGPPETLPSETPIVELEPLNSNVIGEIDEVKQTVCESLSKAEVKYKEDGAATCTTTESKAVHVFIVTVYEIITLPSAMPVTKPLISTAAVKGSDDNHSPFGVEFNKETDEFTQIVASLVYGSWPKISATIGKGSTVICMVSID